MPRLRLPLFTLGCLLLTLAVPSPSPAAASPLVINTLTPKLEAAPSGGGSKLKLEFTNITDGPATLEVEAVGQEACKPVLKKSQLPENQTTAVEVEIPGSCDRKDDALKLDITANLFHQVPQVFHIDPEGSPPAKPKWEALFVFPILLLLSIDLAALFLFKGWKPQSTLHSPGNDPAGQDKRWRKLWDRLRQPLATIDVSTWKFNDNWATNVTAAGALLTGIFGATTAKAFLGENAESLTALATVGAAITAILVSAAPIAVLATKSYTHEGEPGDFFTVGGILLGAAVVFTAAVGQLGIVAYTATELDIGILATAAIWIGFVLAVVLLTAYTCRSLKALLERGTEAPSKDPEVAIEAAKLIAEAIKGEAAGGDPMQEQFKRRGLAPKAHPEATRATAWRRHPRSALI